MNQANELDIVEQLTGMKIGAQQNNNFPQLILPPNEQITNINHQTSTRINAKHEREDFAYIGSKDIIGYEQFAELFEKLQSTGQQFQDKNFPNNLSSLIEKEGSRYKPNEFFKGEYNLFVKSLNTFEYNDPTNYKQTKTNKLEGIEPEDIKQGELGDCYFLASLAAIAEFPWRIKQLFITRKVNQQGIYCIKLFHFGQWKAIIIDDYFPCNARGPAFTRGNDNEIWVLILEKAWAKLFGSYERIESGQAREALNSLTGAPTEYIFMDYPTDELWNKIQNADQQNFIMTCGSQLNSNQMGIVTSHAYTLIGCKQYKGAQLILLRNPWGTKEWKGKWSDSEKIWTPELRKELNHNPDANDGTFYIELTDFKKYFTDLSICYYKDNYQQTSLKVQSDVKHATYIRMEVTEASDYYISINQETSRMFEINQTYQYSLCKLLIAKFDQNTKSYQWIGGKQYHEREMWINVNLTPGEYLIYVKTYWFDKQPRCFVLGSYGKCQVKFQLSKKAEFPHHLLEGIMLTHPRTRVEQITEHPGIEKCYEMFSKEGFGILWIRNKSQNNFTVSLTLIVMEGLKLRKPFRGNALKFSVPSGKKMIALVNVNFKEHTFKIRESYRI